MLGLWVCKWKLVSVCTGQLPNTLPGLRGPCLCGEGATVCESHGLWLRCAQVKSRYLPLFLADWDWAHRHHHRQLSSTLP